MKKSVVREYFESLVIAVVLALFVRTWVFQAFKIPTGSMEQNLLVGDHLIVNKMVFAPAAAGWERAIMPSRPIRRGDVVVFNGVDSFTPEVQIDEPTGLLPKAVDWFGRTFGFAPPDERDFVKRVIGVGGDHADVVGGLDHVVRRRVFVHGFRNHVEPRRRECNLAVSDFRHRPARAASGASRPGMDSWIGREPIRPRADRGSRS